jgi:hypothetical protein
MLTTRANNTHTHSAVNTVIKLVLFSAWMHALFASCRPAAPACMRPMIEKLKDTRDCECFALIHIQICIAGPYNSTEYIDRDALRGISILFLHPTITVYLNWDIYFCLDPLHMFIWDWRIVSESIRVLLAGQTCKDSCLLVSSSITHATHHHPKLATRIYVHVLHRSESSTLTMKAASHWNYVLIVHVHSSAQVHMTRCLHVHMHVRTCLQSYMPLYST